MIKTVYKKADTIALRCKHLHRKYILPNMPRYMQMCSYV